MCPFLKIRKIKPGGLCRPVECTFTSCPLLTESLVQVLSDNVETLKNFGCTQSQAMTQRSAASRGWLLGGMSETRNVWTHRQFYENKSWKLCWYAREPDRVSVVEITKCHPYCTRHWYLDICWLGIFCSFECILYNL